MRRKNGARTILGTPGFSGDSDSVLETHGDSILETFGDGVCEIHGGDVAIYTLLPTLAPLSACRSIGSRGRHALGMQVVTRQVEGYGVVRGTRMRVMFRKAYENL